jgi:hypothetical protein
MRSFLAYTEETKQHVRKKTMVGLESIAQNERYMSGIFANEEKNQNI